jgi:putative phosphoesterase
MEIGVISDTHGLLRPEALSALQGSDLIIHAGDVGNAQILDRLSNIAPIHAVRGNTDRGEFGSSLPLTTVVEIPWTRNAMPAPPLLIYVIHILEDLDIVPEAAGMGVVICGHTHRPKAEWRGDILYLNPGSAGPRRFRDPITVARLGVSGGPDTRPTVEWVHLASGPEGP